MAEDDGGVVVDDGVLGVGEGRVMVVKTPTALHGLRPLLFTALTFQ